MIGQRQVGQRQVERSKFRVRSLLILSGAVSRYMVPVVASEPLPELFPARAWSGRPDGFPVFGI